MTLRIGMAQMLVEGGCAPSNIARAVARIGRAAERGCRLVVLPECLDFGWTHGSARSLAQPIPGPHSDALADAARKHQIYVAAGLVERCDESLFNTAVLIDADGRLLTRHRKINELGFARELYCVGDRQQLSVAKTALGVLAINICADNFAESLDIGHTLGRLGAEILLSPCAWAVVADHDNQRRPYGDFWRIPFGELAREHRMSIVAVSNVGPITDGQWAGRLCIGCSLAIDAGGEQVVQGPYGQAADELIVIEL